MKFLKNESVMREAEGVKVWVKPITTEIQTKILGMANDNSPAGMVATTLFCLKNIVKKIESDGVNLIPLEIANKADLSDDDTLAEFLAIGGLIMEACFPPEFEEKKSD